MSRGVRSNGKNSAASKRDSLGCETNIDRICQREANLFYRNPLQDISSDSANNSSLRNSLSKEFDEMQSNPGPSSSGHDFSHHQIVDQLSKLKVSEKKDYNNGDVGSVNRRFRAHSILAGNTPTDSMYHRTVDSLAEFSSSAVLAGGFNDEQNVEAAGGEPSILNVAINESEESNSGAIVPCSGGSRESNPDRSIRYTDSLELEREKRSIVVEKDSLEGQAPNVGRNADKKSWTKNVENMAGRSVSVIEKHQNLGKPIVRSDERVAFDLRTLRTRGDERLLIFDKKEKCIASKDKNDNVEYDADDSRTRDEAQFISLINESENRVISGLETPKLAATYFIENCYKSTPAGGIMADTFSSDLLSDITSLSVLGDNVNTKAGQSSFENREMSCCRDNILKKFSHRFAEAPTEFTFKLISLLEESILHTKLGNNNASGVSLSRVTEEFRKICREYNKRIEDETMPNFGSFQVSSPPINESQKKTEGEEETANLTAQNFTSFGGGKKVYRKTPRRIMKTCDSPNCANIYHRIENAGSDSVLRKLDAGNTLDNTETFEFWENLCYEMSPTKQAKFHLPRIDGSELLSREDLIRKSDRQMAALDQSYASPTKPGETGRLISGEKNSLESWRTLRNSNVSESHENFERFNSKETCEEIDRILAARLVEKRRRCFEEAARASKSKCDVKPSETRVDSEFLTDPGSDAVFISTLTACVDYFDGIKCLKDQRHSLQCIVECSEESTISEMEKTTDSKSLKCVEAIIMPVKYIAEYETRNMESSNPRQNESMKVAEAYLELSGTPQSSAAFEDGRLENLDDSFASPWNGHRLSPSRRSPRIISKKIKRSISPNVRRCAKLAKPESYSNLSQSPTTTGLKGKEKTAEKNRRIVADSSGLKSSPRFSSKKKTAADSPGLMDITNIQKSSNQPPKIVIMKPTPPACDSTKKSNHPKIVDENTEVPCRRELEFSGTETPEQRKKKYFYTPGKTPTVGRVRPKQKYFATPRRNPAVNKPPMSSPSTPGSHRFNYNTVLSPVGMYIRGTNPNLITNVRAKTNERMLTPRSKTPRSNSNAVSPILARSPRLSPKQTETSRLKFKLSSAKKTAKQSSDILNIALCESDPSSSRGAESVSTSPFPKIFYKSAACVKMVNEPSQQRCGGSKTLAKATQEKIIYRHEGRLVSARLMEEQHKPCDGHGTESSSPSISVDVSLLHKRSATKTNYLCKK